MSWPVIVMWGTFKKSALIYWPKQELSSSGNLSPVGRLSIWDIWPCTASPWYWGGAVLSFILYVQKQGQYWKCSGGGGQRWPLIQSLPPWKRLGFYMSDFGLVSSDSCLFLKVNWLFAETEIKYGQWARGEEGEGWAEGGTSLVTAVRNLYASACLGKWC